MFDPEHFLTSEWPTNKSNPSCVSCLALWLKVAVHETAIVYRDHFLSWYSPCFARLSGLALTLVPASSYYHRLCPEAPTFERPFQSPIPSNEPPNIKIKNFRVCSGHSPLVLLPSWQETVSPPCCWTLFQILNNTWIRHGYKEGTIWVAVWLVPQQPQC